MFFSALSALTMAHDSHTMDLWLSNLRVATSAPTARHGSARARGAQSPARHGSAKHGERSHQHGMGVQSMGSAVISTARECRARRRAQA